MRLILSCVVMAFLAFPVFAGDCGGGGGDIPNPNVRAPRQAPRAQGPVYYTVPQAPPTRAIRYAVIEEEVLPPVAVRRAAPPAVYYVPTFPTQTETTVRKGPLGRTRSVTVKQN